MYLGDFEEQYDGGLGKLKLKKIVKSATKAVGQVAKVAVAPAAIAAASSLQAAGLRHAASQVVQKTALNKKIAAAEQKFTKAAGVAIDVAAAATAATIAAPYIASAGATAAHAAGAAGAKGLLLAKTLGKNKGLLGPLSSLLKKKSGGGDSSGSSDTSSSVADEVKAAGQSYLRRGMRAASPDGSEAPAPADSSAPAPSFAVPPAGTDAASAPAPADSTPPADAAAEPEKKKVSPWLVLLPAALFLL